MKEKQMCEKIPIIKNFNLGDGDLFNQPLICTLKKSPNKNKLFAFT